MQENESGNKKHNLILKGRHELLLDGILDVMEFDDKSVSLKTALGGLMVEGSELHITKMSLESGDVAIEGRISGIFYEEVHEKTGGFFSRVFK